MLSAWNLQTFFSKREHDVSSNPPDDSGLFSSHVNLITFLTTKQSRQDNPEFSGIRNLSACWFKFYLDIIILLHFMKRYYETEFLFYLLLADVYLKSSFMPILQNVT
jgi:hypothetical protein